MRTRKIRKMIQDAVADEERTGRLASLGRQVARDHGVAMTDADVNGVVAFVREYAEHVPLLMEQASEGARQLGLAPEMEQMLRELESYWFQADDLLPDHLGLIGLADDAYATLILLQGFSDYARASYGRPLLDIDLTTANRGMRGLIGEPVASTLEQRVGVTLANAMMHRLLGQVASAGFMFPSTPDPIWGNASIDEIVNTRLGAMGVI